MTATLHKLPRQGPQLLTKQQLAQHLGRSPRWIELRVNEGMPSENLDRRGRRLFDLRAVEDWLAAGQPQAVTLAERVERMEGEMARLRERIRKLGVPMSMARYHVAMGHVSVNGQITTDLDIDLDAIDGEEITVQLDRAEPRDSIVRLLQMGAPTGGEA